MMNYATIEHAYSVSNMRTLIPVIASEGYCAYGIYGPTYCL